MNSRQLGCCSLPLCAPLVKTFPSDSFLFSIVQNIDTGYDWIMNNFIQIQGELFTRGRWIFQNRPYIYFVPMAKPSLNYGAFYFCPYVSTSTISRQFLFPNKQEFLERIMQLIDKGNYISILHLFIKYKLSQNNKSLKDIVERIDSVFNEYSNILRVLLENLPC